MILTRFSQEPHHLRGKSHSIPVMDQMHFSVWITNAGSDICAFKPYKPKYHDTSGYVQ